MTGVEYVRITTRNLERQSGVLREIRDVLARIEENQFGQCLNCDEEISAKRLLAVPWTPLCLTCKEQQDRSQSRHSGREDWLAREAA